MSHFKPHRPPLSLLRLALFTALTLAAFACLVGVIALLLAWWQDSGTPTGAGGLLGVICGLIAWLFVAIFHLKRETITLAFDAPEPFLRRVRAQLEAMGYSVTAPSESVLLGRPAFRSLLFGGQVVVRLGDTQALLIGPKIYLERLRSDCRVHNHMAHAHRALPGMRRRLAEPLLSLAEIRLRVAGERLPEVYREIATALAREGATLECELCIRARSELGLRERVLDRQILERLKERQIAAEVRKEAQPQQRHPACAWSA